MTDFMNVVSNSNVPAASGFVVGVGPGPMRGFFATLGNFGTGSPVTKAQVQKVAAGAWYDIVGATVTGNGAKNFLAYGVAVRIVVPALTAPGAANGITAPRVAYAVQNMLNPDSGHCAGGVAVGNSTIIAGANTTGSKPSAAGIVSLAQSLNPNLPHVAPAKSIVFLTGTGNGTEFIESRYTDGDGDFWIQEGSSITGASGQVSCESFGEAHRVNFTQNSATTDLVIDQVKLPF